MTGAEEDARWCATGRAHAPTGPLLASLGAAGRQSQEAMEAAGAEAEAAADGLKVADGPTVASQAPVAAPDAEARRGARSAEAYFVPVAPGFFFSAFFIRA